MLDKIKDLLDELVKHGLLPEWLANNVGLALIIFGIISASINLLWGLIKNYFLERNQRKISEDLHPYYTIEDVKRATQYYIPTQFQNVAPSEDDEPGRQFLAVPKANLLNFFLKKAFLYQGDSNRFYLILADSGMGKTTFLINLFLKYQNQRTWFWSMPKYEIRLLPLGSKEALNEVDKIENKRNTILLLDAFDEDIEALGGYQQRINLIVEKVKNFREVVITCRTQFFPSKEEEPHTTKIFTFGDGLNSQIKFQKSYLSVFDDNDIRRYIRKRFPFFKFIARVKAFKIVQNCPNLLVRPMLLSHIEDLIKSNIKFEFTHQIYEALIERWTQRESGKPGIIEKFGSTEKYGKLLLDLSQKIALNLYKNREIRKGYSIYKDEKIENIPELQLSELEKEYTNLGREIKSKSLLNRNGEGFYKFSHKSILEYFLAKILAEKPRLLEEFDFTGMDMTILFHSELICHKIRLLDGKYSSNYYNKDRNSQYLIIVYKTINLFENCFNRYLFRTTIKKEGIEVNMSSLSNFDVRNKFNLTINNCSRIDPIELCSFKNAQRIVLMDLEHYKLCYELRDFIEISKFIKDRSKEALNETIIYRNRKVTISSLEKQLEATKWLITNLKQNGMKHLAKYLSDEKENLINSGIKTNKGFGLLFKQNYPESVQLLNSENTKLKFDCFYFLLNTLDAYNDGNYVINGKEVLSTSIFLEILYQKDSFFSPERIRKLQKINEFIKNAQKLQEKLLDCEVLF